MIPDKIKIRTGANLSSILQSTVTIQQAFTELVKNSIQNTATFTKIYLNKDNAIIIDDGLGFDDTVDDTGLTGFEKYFVFGNSYTQDGDGIRLGHMGIGGKISNDKLSKSKDPDWSIETKNRNGRCYVIHYKPGPVEFLDDYEPSITEIATNDCSIETPTGTKIVINKLDSNIERDGWNKKHIVNELRAFFGRLVVDLKKENKVFNLFVDDQTLDFSYKLPGLQLGETKRSFQYIINGEEKTSTVWFDLAIVNNDIKKDCLLDGIDIISNVKICALSLPSHKMINEIYLDISRECDHTIEIDNDIMQLFSDLRGFIVCGDISTVLDDTGMPAKDLSHHGLRADHPLTMPLLKVVYRNIIDLLRAYSLIKLEEKRSKVNRLAFIISKLVTRSCEIDDELLKEDNDEDCTDINVNMREVFAANGVPLEHINRVRGAAYDMVRDPHNSGKHKVREWWQKGSGIGDVSNILAEILPDSYTVNTGEKSLRITRPDTEPSLEHSEPAMIPITPALPERQICTEGSSHASSLPETVENAKDQKNTEIIDIPDNIKDSHINFEIKSFGAGLEHDVSDVSLDPMFTVLINRDNIRYKIYEKEQSPLLLLLYISEAMIKEINIYANPNITKKDIDSRMSMFYDKSYDIIREKILQIT